MYCNKCGSYVDSNNNFCNKCGNKINNNTNNINKKLEKNIIIKIVLIVAIICILVGVAILIINNKKYRISDEGYTTSEVVTTNNDKNAKKGKYTTAIIYDNVYEGVSIKSVSEANELIEKDSVDQKSNCPKDILEIENEFINKYNITAVNLCEMDIDFARELQSVFKTIYDEYPEARKHLTNLTLRNTNMLTDGHTIAAFMPTFPFATSNSSSTYPWVIKTQVLLSSSFFLNKEKLEAGTKASSEAGHFPPNSNIYSPVAHELGHYLSYLAMTHNYKLDDFLLIDSSKINLLYTVMNDFADGKFSLKMITEAYENYKRDTNTSLSLDEWRGTISSYALAKNNDGKYIYDETIAEAFHDTYLNHDNAKDASKYIIKVLKKYMGN